MTTPKVRKVSGWAIVPIDDEAMQRKFVPVEAGWGSYQSWVFASKHLAFDFIKDKGEMPFAYDLVPCFITLPTPKKRSKKK